MNGTSNESDQGREESIMTTLPKIEAEYVMVPVEPTEEMVEAATLSDKRNGSAGKVRQVYRAMLSAVPPIQPEEGWRPIETAPVDQRIFLWCSDLLGEPEWDERAQRKVRQPIGLKFGMVRRYGDLPPEPKGEGMNGDWTFTHWMPLPVPPILSPTRPDHGG